MQLTVVKGWTEQGPTGASYFTTGPVSEEVAALVTSLWENGANRVEITVEPCVHNGLFADRNAPDYHDHAAYEAWLDTTHPCRTCGSRVANRDL